MHQWLGFNPSYMYEAIWMPRNSSAVSRVLWHSFSLPLNPAVENATCTLRIVSDSNSNLIPRSQDLSSYKCHKSCTNIHAALKALYVTYQRSFRAQPICHTMALHESGEMLMSAYTYLVIFPHIFRIAVGRWGSSVGKAVN